MTFRGRFVLNITLFKLCVHVSFIFWLFPIKETEKQMGLVINTAKTTLLSVA